jgi:HEAT repeat protein
MSRSTPDIPHIPRAGMFQGVPIPYDKPPEEIERDLGRSVSQAAAACRALAANESPEALAVLQRALEAKDWSVRRLAVEALGLHVNGREARALVRRLQVRKEAAWTLRANTSSGNWRALFQAWRSHRLARHRVWACEVAGAFGDTNIEPELVPLAGDEDGHVRKAAARALREIRREPGDP